MAIPSKCSSNKDLVEISIDKDLSIASRSNPNIKMSNLLLLEHLLALIEENFCEEEKFKTTPSTLFMPNVTKMIEEINKGNTSLEEKTFSKEDLEKKIEDLWIDHYAKNFLDITHNKKKDNIVYVENNLYIIEYLQMNWVSSNDLIKKLNVVLPDNDFYNEMNKYGKKTLILDMDETLLHCDSGFKYEVHDKILTRVFNGEEFNLPIIYRPFLSKFLKFARANFEVIIYTASDQKYADAILDHLDPHGKVFSHRLYRKSVIHIKDKIFTKPLEIIQNRLPQNIIIVDNSIFNFLLNPTNGYLIPSFYQDKYDCELLKLEAYLKEVIIGCDDVRIANKDKYKLISK